MSDELTPELYKEITNPLYRESLLAAAERDDVDPAYKYRLIDYVVAGEHPGNFLEAVITNDLFRAFRHSEATRKTLYPVVMFLWRWAPAACWGRESALDVWRIAHRRHVEAAAEAAVKGRIRG